MAPIQAERARLETELAMMQRRMEQQVRRASGEGRGTPESSAVGTGTGPGGSGGLVYADGSAPGSDSMSTARFPLMCCVHPVCALDPFCGQCGSLLWSTAQLPLSSTSR